MRTLRYAGTLALVFLLAGTAQASNSRAGQAPGLKIIVIAGEDAVNIIQQGTAVAPVVEVRDRNDQPVAGVIVTFAVRGGGQTATFAGGSPTFTATTDAAGRATASQFSPIASGRVQIDVTAAHQGQTATATVSQTNFATAAAAGAAGAGVADGAAAGAAAGGHGLSGVVIGAIAAAGVGGAVVAAKIAGGSSADPTPPSGGNPTPTPSPTPTPAPPPTPSPTPTPAPPVSRTYTGPLSGRLVMTTTSGGTLPTTCVSTRDINGTLTMTLVEQLDGTVTGSASTAGTVAEVAITQSPFCQAMSGTIPFNTAGSITGTPGNFGYTFVSSGSTGPTPSGGSVSSSNTTSFAGALSNGVISGAMTHTATTTGQNPPPGGPINGSGTTTFPVTLR